MRLHGLHANSKVIHFWVLINKLYVHYCKD